MLEIYTLIKPPNSGIQIFFLGGVVAVLDFVTLERLWTPSYWSIITRLSTLIILIFVLLNQPTPTYIHVRGTERCEMWHLSVLWPRSLWHLLRTFRRLLTFASCSPR